MYIINLIIDFILSIDIGWTLKAFLSFDFILGVIFFFFYIAMIPIGIIQIMINDIKQIHLEKRDRKNS